MAKTTSPENHYLPDFFKPLLWSYDFSQIDPRQHQKTIIVNTLNYGDLKHWRWIVHFYGLREIKKILRQVSISEIRLPVRRLITILFGIKNFNYAPRGSK